MFRTIDLTDGDAFEDDDDSCTSPRLCFYPTTHIPHVLTPSPLVFLSPDIDPSTLCPYCDEPLPATPTPHLLTLLSTTLQKSYPDPRPSNPKGRKAPLGVFIGVCQRHRFERIRLPEAIRMGWPIAISWGEVRGRVEGLVDVLRGVLEDVGAGTGGESESEEESGEGREGKDKGKEKGPRARSVFWKEVKKEVKKKGTRAVVGVSGQFASFEKTQPG